MFVVVVDDADDVVVDDDDDDDDEQRIAVRVQLDAVFSNHLGTQHVSEHVGLKLCFWSCVEIGEPLGTHPKKPLCWLHLISNLFKSILKNTNTTTHRRSVRAGGQQQICFKRWLLGFAHRWLVLMASGLDPLFLQTSDCGPQASASRSINPNADSADHQTQTVAVRSARWP